VELDLLKDGDLGHVLVDQLHQLHPLLEQLGQTGMNFLELLVVF